MRARIAIFACLIVLCGAASGWSMHRIETNTFVRADADLTPTRADWVKLAKDIARPAYAEHCAACHGARLQGDPAQGAPRLSDRDWLYGEGKVSEIEKTIYYGIRSHNSKGWNLADMPAFGRLTASNSRYRDLTRLNPGEIDDVVQYIFRLAGREADAQSAARGATIFDKKGNCYDCHGADARGDAGVGAPNLIDSTWLYGDGSARSVAGSIEWGRRGSCPAWIGRLDSLTIRSLALYIYAVAHQNPEP